MTNGVIGVNAHYLVVAENKSVYANAFIPNLHLNVMVRPWIVETVTKKSVLENGMPGQTGLHAMLNVEQGLYSDGEFVRAEELEHQTAMVRLKNLSFASWIHVHRSGGTGVNGRLVRNHVIAA